MQKGGFRRVLKAFGYSISGLISCYKEERAFREVCVLGVLGVMCALAFGSDFHSKIILALPSFICIIVELLNSAIENAVDFTSKDIHPLAKKAKDMGSAAQLVALVYFGLTWTVFIFA